MVGGWQLSWFPRLPVETLEVDTCFWDCEQQSGAAFFSDGLAKMNMTAQEETELADSARFFLESFKHLGLLVFPLILDLFRMRSAVHESHEPEHAGDHSWLAGDGAR